MKNDYRYMSPVDIKAIFESIIRNSGSIQEIRNRLSRELNYTDGAILQEENGQIVAAELPIGNGYVIRL